MISKKELVELGTIVGASMNKDRTLNASVFVGKLQYFLSRKYNFNLRQFTQAIDDEYRKRFLTQSGKESKKVYSNGVRTVKLNPKNQAICKTAIDLGNMSEAGRLHGVSRELVRQLLKAHYGITAKKLRDESIEKKVKEIEIAVQTNALLTCAEASRIYKIPKSRIIHLFPNDAEVSHLRRVAAGVKVAVSRNDTVWCDKLIGMEIGDTIVVDVSAMKSPVICAHNISKRVGIPIATRRIGDGYLEVTRTKDYKHSDLHYRRVKLQELKCGETIIVDRDDNWRRDAKIIGVKIKSVHIGNGKHIITKLEDNNV